MIAALLVTAAYGCDAEPERTLAQRVTTAGTIEVSPGSAAVVGGVAVLFGGRGCAGEISEESNGWHDARTVGGSVLILAGATTIAIGVDSLSRGARLREQDANKPQARLSPLLVPHGGGVAFDLTF